MSFHKILVAIDLNEHSDVVFDRALHLAKTDGASMMVMNTVEMPLEDDLLPMSGAGIGADLVLSEDFQATYHKNLQTEIARVRTQLGRYAEKGREKGVSVEFDCQVGDPGRRICQLAKMWDADLVMLGRRGRRGLQEMLLGSVSNYVLHRSPCSVMVVQGVEAS
ncbi:MAG: universal stress protein [Cyanobacteria bacterium SID2]|nr:universal stress protein [Cyanobacteria bacterium SID2]MBP0002654.1 universal stress protein [Cyanobacteria bacterium SBC]